LNQIRTCQLERRVFSFRGDEVEEFDSSACTERQAIARQQMQILREELGRLAEGRAKALVLHDVLGYQLKEIAEADGTTVAAVQSRLVRGRRDLEENLRRRLA
jgi:RNA polymerase sigma-70 factor (ECF subfamily)